MVLAHHIVRVLEDMITSLERGSRLADRSPGKGGALLLSLSGGAGRGPLPLMRRLAAVPARVAAAP